MARAIQKRTLETRARLVSAAQEIIETSGFEALRIEEVVLRAGTAKGTFFAHFKDKDALMDLIIGEKIDALLDVWDQTPPPETVDALVTTLMPVCALMTRERYVFDVILRYSGAAAIEEIGVIANTFGRQINILEGWLGQDRFRGDVSPELMAEGVHAFMLQAMAVNFCALHNTLSIEQRLSGYLRAWLMPKR